MGIVLATPNKGDSLKVTPLKYMHKKRIIAGILVSTVVLSSIFSVLVLYPPYHLTAIAPPDVYYTKPHHNLGDYYVYLAAIRQGRLGISGINRYTTDRVPTQHLHIYYEFLGQIAQKIGVTDTMMYYLAIVAALFLSTLTALLFIHTLVPRGYRVLAGFFVFFSGPLPPWWFSLFGIKIFLGTSYWTRTDVWSRYAMVPHHGMGAALTGLSTWFLFRFVEKEKPSDAVVSGLLYSASAVVFFVPVFLYGVSFVLLFAGMGAYYGLLIGMKKMSVRELRNTCKKRKTVFLGLCMIGMLTALTGFFMFRMGPVASMVSAEHHYGSSEQFPFLFSLFVLSHGILLLLYPFAVWRMKRVLWVERLFLVSITVTPWILYLLSAWGIFPVAKYRLVFTSPYLFGGILATLGLIRLLPRVRKKFRGFVIFGTTLVILSTGIGNILSYWVEMTKPTYPYVNIYIPKPVMEGVAYLAASIPPYSHVLTTFFTGMYIPSYTYASVYVGHELLSPNSEDKLWFSLAFFNGTMALDEARRFLKDNTIEYVFWNVPESPSRYSDILEEVFQNNSVMIFKVVL